VRQPVPFGKYLLLDRISVGGMAEVFKAKSYGVEGFEKIIAIKRILPSMGEDRDFIKMFIDEAKIAGQLAHANICQIFELGRIEGAHFIAMEYIWGKDLLQMQNRLRKLRRPMPVDMACFVLAKVCEGLDYAHRKRDAMGRPLEIVHRDCSPQNILLSYEGEVKVIDFGIAKAAMRNSRTMAGVLKGKFGYMSPEQVRGLPLDRRSDIFALGTMLYECLTSDRLFQGETDFSTLEKVRNVDIQRPRSINPEIPEEVERIILKALAKDTEDRYQWCGDMHADLQQYLMRQPEVFTAKTLAVWNKDVFGAEVERERVALESYKRIGRDGLIAGVPAADARLDVVEHLGAAGQSEDPTMLGGPSFDDVDLAQGISTVEVGPASGSPAALGSGRSPNEFGEEAPTEIFGEIQEPEEVDDLFSPRPPPSSRPTVPNQTAAAPMRPAGLGGSATASMGSPTPRPHHLMPSFGPSQMGSATGSTGPESEVPRLQSPPGSPAPGAPDPRYPPMDRPFVGAPVGTGMSRPDLNGPMPGMGPGPGMMARGPGMAPGPGGMGPGGHGPGPMGGQGIGRPMGPGSMNYPANGGAQGFPGPGFDPSQPAGSAAPPAGWQPQHQPAGAPSGTHTLIGMYAPSSGGPSQPAAHPGAPGAMGGQGVMQSLPLSSGLGQPYGVSPYGYGNGRSGSGPAPAVAVPAEGKRQPKKSSVVRDIAIGVSIAAAVLATIVIVKLTILDQAEPTPPIGPAMVSIVLSGGSGTLSVDGEDLRTVDSSVSIPTSPGTRQVKVTASDGAVLCDQSVDLVAGETQEVRCSRKTDAPAPPPVRDSAGDPPATSRDAGRDAGTSAVDASSSAQDARPRSPDSTAVSPDAAVARPVPPATATEPAGVVKSPAAKPEPKPRRPEIKGGKRPIRAQPPAHSPKDPPKNGLPLVDVSPTVTPGKGYLVIMTNPSGARVLLDGVDTGKVTPVGNRQRISALAGKRQVTLVLGEDKWNVLVDVEAGATEAIDERLRL
jgi:serine/threonine protein kinase